MIMGRGRERKLLGTNEVLKKVGHLSQYRNNGWKNLRGKREKPQVRARKRAKSRENEGKGRKWW